MRLKLLYKILDEATEEGRLILRAEPIYGGQAYKVYNFELLRQALLDLKGQNLLLVDMPELVEQTIISNKKDSVVFSNAEFAELQNFVNNANQTLPTVLTVLRSFSPKQDEQILNIKLPEGLGCPEQYSSFNKRITALFQKFGISKEGIHIVGFDSGSQWYEVLCQNANWIFPFIVSCLQLGFEVWKARKDTKKQSEAQFTVDIINNNFATDNKKITVDDYLDKIVDEKIQRGIDERLEKLGTPAGKTREESKVMLVTATKALVKELGEGTEFHLSLNPPDYVKDGATTEYFTIDYNSIPKPDKLEKSKETLSIDEGSSQKEELQEQG